MKNYFKKAGVLLIGLLLFNCASESLNDETTQTTISAFSEQYNYYGEMISIDYDSDGQYMKKNLPLEVIEAIETGIFTNGSGERDWYLFNNKQDLDAWNANQTVVQKASTESFTLYTGFNQTGNLIYQPRISQNSFKYPPAHVRSRAKSYIWGFRASKVTMAYGTNGTRTKRTYNNESSTGNLRQHVSNADFDYLWRVRWN